jgi:hypothetical protein
LLIVGKVAAFARAPQRSATPAELVNDAPQAVPA